MSLTNMTIGSKMRISQDEMESYELEKRKLEWDQIGSLTSMFEITSPTGRQSRAPFYNYTHNFVST